ncbi:MAG: nucleotidyltransferase domain-containing protein [Candidatus Nanohaloarchaeota archaeon QJJ-9]|nr:nucleotidyltransferase domain-containing protein [Candidatus Nanohaloarchaeota archaeon QJJ-9]
MGSKDKLNKAKEKSQERRMEKVEEFADKLVEKLEDKVKCVAVYGSVPEGRHTHESDIDTFVVLDDTKLEEDVPSDAKDKIRRKVTKLAKQTDERITIQYFEFLTDFWDSVVKGEPLALAVLRKGEPVYDVGVFMPAKRMLDRGKISSTQESVKKRLKMAAAGYKKSEKKMKSSIPHTLEQVMANAGQAPIMLVGKTPPNKEDVGNVLREMFVENDIMDEEYADIADELHEFADKAEKSPDKVTPEEVGEHLEKTDDFIRRMHELVGQLGTRKKVKDIVDDYKTFLKANVAALKSEGIEPPEDKEDLPEVVKEQLDVEEEHSEMFEEWEEVISKVKDKELDDINDKKLYELKQRTKEFASRVGRDLQEKTEGEASDMAPTLDTDKIAKEAKGDISGGKPEIREEEIEEED